MKYREDLSPEEQYLCLAIRGERTEDERSRLEEIMNMIGPERCFEVAARNKVGPLVASALATEYEDSLFDTRWRGLYQANTERVAGLLEVLQMVSHQLGRWKIPSAVIENGGVLLATGTPPAAFASGDFDLLVEEEAWSRALEAFSDLGFEQEDRRHRPTNRIEFRRGSNSGDPVWINAAFAPFDRMWVPLRYNDRSVSWLRRRVAVDGLQDVSVLEPTDSLVLACVHTSLHSYVRSPFIRLHADADWLVRKCGIDWKRFVEEVENLGLPTRVWMSLEMARFLLGTPVPDWVTGELAPKRSTQRKLLWLIAREGTFASANRKLTGWKAIWLDEMLSESGFVSWFGQLLWPEEKWLLDHFDPSSTGTLGKVGLNVSRLTRALRSWRPE